MSHEKLAKDRLSYRLPSLLPEYLREEAPAFEAFLKAYFEFLESEVLVLTSQSDIDGLLLEDGTGSALFESATVSPSPDQDSSKILYETTSTNPLNTADPLAIGEYIVGSISKSVAKIEVINGNTLYLKSISGNGFAEGETVTGRKGGQSAVVKSFKENSILANNRLLDYSDIDNTTEDFLKYFQKDFMPSIDLAVLKNKRLTIKNISDLYKKKGTTESIQFLMRVLYNDDATVRHPIDETIHVGESGYTQERRMRVLMDKGIPEANDRITQYDSLGVAIVAQAVIENVYVPPGSAVNEYSFEIMNNHVGTFTEGSKVTILDRDGVTLLTATVQGVISDVTTGSSTYVGHGTGDILLEDGAGLLMETKVNPFGSLYSLNDQINIKGSKLDTDVTETLSRVNGLVEGSIKEILIETAGTSYNASDLIIFEGGVGTGNAEAVIGSTGDEMMQEGGSAFGHYEIISSAGQTQVGGPGVKDDNGHFIIFNDNKIDVYVDGLLKIPTTDYTWKNDRVVFTSALTAGQNVEIYTEYNRITYEDGTLINYDAIIHSVATGGDGSIDSDDGRVRSVFIRDGGQYTQIPKVFPGGYMYVNAKTINDTNGQSTTLENFAVGEVVTGITSNARGAISSIDLQNKRLVIKRLPTDTGLFQVGETIEGGVSDTTAQIVQHNVTGGTGAKMFAFSDDIGGVASINIIDQGSKFNYDGLLSSSSFFNIVIKTPSATLFRDTVLTGTLSGTTAKVVKYDADRHILTYKDLEGEFFDNEKVTFNAADSFTTIKGSTFDGRGLFAGEGIIEEQIVGDYGTLNANASRMQDGLLYQTHSYVIKVNNSINKWRGIVKDLLHPAGHIFFGELAFNSKVSSAVSADFLPVIVIKKVEDASVQNDHLEKITKVQIFTLSEYDEDGNFLKIVHDPLTILDEAGQPAYATNPVTGGALSNFLQSVATGGVQTGRGTEYYDSMMRSRHFNVNVINSFATAPIQSSPRRDSQMSVLNLRNIDKDWVIVEDERNRYGRPADQGKTHVIYTPNQENLVWEDGTFVEQESIRNYLRFDEAIAGNVHYQGMFGERIVTEDGLDLINLEDASVDPETAQLFLTERSIELTSGGLYMEDGDHMVFETGQALLQENMSNVGIHSYVPFGSTFRSLNTITGQRTYNISNYIHDESGDSSQEDRIILEGSTDALLMESSIPEGVRIQDLTNIYPNLYLPEFEKQEKRRTNITYSAYVNSSNITNSVLVGL
jgi:hypothetical protein